MNKKLIKRIFPLIVFLCLVPWPVAYAYEADATLAREETAQIQVAEASAQPTWTAFGKAIRGVDTPGDLFYINATDNPANIQVTLHITNAQELSRSYRHLILKVGIYVESHAGEWERADQFNGKPTPDAFITLCNGQASFTLSGYADYKVTIDSGSFSCITTNADGGNLSPQFFLELDQV